MLIILGLEKHIVTNSQFHSVMLLWLGRTFVYSKWLTYGHHVLHHQVYKSQVCCFKLPYIFKDSFSRSCFSYHVSVCLFISTLYYISYVSNHVKPINSMFINFNNHDIPNHFRAIGHSALQTGLHSRRFVFLLLHHRLNQLGSSFTTIDYKNLFTNKSKWIGIGGS